MRQKRIKAAIVLLAVLLALSLAFLIGILVYKDTAPSSPATVTVPDNIVTPDAEVSSIIETTQSASDTTGHTETSSAAESNIVTPDDEVPSVTETNQSASDTTGHTETSLAAETNNSTNPKNETSILLHNRNNDYNTPFKVENMFPGDSETKFYCVRVFHKGDVILRFHIDIRLGYEKLAEVLCCRISLPENGGVIYDGLIRDMPESLNHALYTDKSTTSEVCYEITNYLDTSVGNEYMNKDLIADFRWWVEETGNLEPSPPTGDSLSICLWLCIAVGALFLLILLWKKRKKEEAVNER